jgi:hypothetical protein
MKENQKLKKREDRKREGAHFKRLRVLLGLTRTATKVDILEKGK